jgi:hypothetical protein
VQRGFYLAQRESGRSPTWAAHIPLDGPLDRDAFWSAAELLISRHAALRAATTITATGAVEQHILPDLALPRRFLDLSTVRGDDLASRLEAEFEEDASASFDPARPPLFSIRLLRIDSARHVVALAAHHIIADAWSCFSLLSEVCAGHDALASGEEPRLPELPLSFRDVACAEPARARDEDRAFWRAALAGADQAAATATTGPARSARIDLSAAVQGALNQHARARGTSPFAAVLGMFAEALGSATARDDVIVSIAVSGRSSARDATARVVGPLARALPIRLTAPFAAGDVARALGGALAHGEAPAAAIAAAAGSQALARLGRYVLSWLDPDALAPLPSRLRPDWSAAMLRFDASATSTEVMLGVMPHAGGLTLHLHGGKLIHAIAPAVAARLTALSAPDAAQPDTAQPDAALIVYAPAGAASPGNPGAGPVIIERVRSAIGISELVLLPLGADALAGAADLDLHVLRAIATTRARVVALAGMLPSHLGLGLTRILDREPAPGEPDRRPIVTTGHAATVAAMFLTVCRALAAVGASFAELRVGALGFGSIGRATWELCRTRLGEPGAFVAVDPRLARSPDPAALADCDLILGASSGGATLDVAALAPGTIVVDDSFPRAFSDEHAWRRMRQHRDVLLAGGGMLDAGPLVRSSPFPEAAAVRRRLPVRWLPGCHAEALVIARRPELGPTRGPVDTARALAVLAALEELGLGAAPLHLGPEELPPAVIEGVAAARSSRRSRAAR